MQNGALSGSSDGRSGASDIVILRVAEPTDLPFITDSWIQSYRGQRIAIDAGPRYIHDMKWLVRALLPRCRAIVACDPEAPGAIWGWAVTSGDTILYTFVREGFRRQGIAKLMLQPYLTPGRKVVYAAKSSVRDLKLPPEWQYSFLAALRLLTT